jgi:diguanylate cyclase (GGDEF)-like protein
MQKIPVVRHPKHYNEFLLIDAADIVKVELVKNRDYIIHTKDEQFYLYHTMESLEELLFEDGFRMIDSDNIVNMNQVTSYDAVKGRVFFGPPQQRVTKTASAARIHKEHIENILKMLQAEKQIEMREITSDTTNPLFDSIIEKNENVRFLRSYATIHSVNEQKKAEKKMFHMAYHDALTNLPNRLQFYERLKELLDRPHHIHKTAILFMDLDRFKVINDTLGHHVGDLLLKYISKQLIELIQPGDMIARFGGDEYIILLAGRDNIEQITAFAELIPKVLSQPFEYYQHKLFTTASIGISLVPDHGEDSETLIKKADTAMYIAKEKGGNTFEIFNPAMDFRSIERLELETALRFALDKREIEVHYQPLIDLQTNQVFGMEALVRWYNPKLGWISPGEFIPLAEETGLIIPIGNYVFKEACRQTKQWMDLGLPALTVSVNISVNQFHQPDFLKFVTATLEETGIQPKFICLEITENVAMKNIAYMLETMNQLKEIGIKISIDDFGTGYSSLNYLKRFRVHTLKIDQSFIKDITEDGDNAAIVTALIAMSQRLKIKSLAEGVETIEQLKFLRDQGCDEIQGFIYSKALPSEAFEQLILEQRPLLA